ncbi:hypothetical protein HJC23_009587 [Cyclotella cryptica]|uniref:Uncharacterized protein n=1 Tax=Cyclotella cryptica TaxID=29204 RepID=A0ABD3PPU7_9STRA|eukprot:CCRYP_012541-RB/>CCRYP_012541-RB protein AED:0.08 eAED:0.08 QI:2732/1/1/1/0.75/0.6/5/875/230
MTNQKIQSLSLLSSVCALVAFILNWIAVAGCSFVRLAVTFGNSSDPSSFSLRFGIWFYQAWTVVASLGGSAVFQGCWRYPDYVEFDSYMKSARAFSVMALIVGAGFMFADFISACTSSQTGGRRVASPSIQGVGYILASIFCALSLLILDSDICHDNNLVGQFTSLFPNVSMIATNCHISTGAKCAISASVFYFLAGASSCYVSKVEKSEVAVTEAGGVTEPLIAADGDL